MKIVITAWEYLFKDNFNEHAFEHKDSRLMDRPTKLALTMARRLYAKVRGCEISSEELGIVISSCTGPIESVRECNLALREKGFTGINPGKYPNIMPATALSKTAIEIGAKGPCVPLLSPQANKHAFEYAARQIAVGRCHAMMIIHISERNDCFGCFMEGEISYAKMRRASDND